MYVRALTSVVDKDYYLSGSLWSINRPGKLKK